MFSRFNAQRERESERARGGLLTLDCQGDGGAGRGAQGVRGHAVVAAGVGRPHLHNDQAGGADCPPGVAGRAARVQQLPPFVPRQ